MADKTPRTLDGVPASIQVGGKVTTLTVETTYTPEKDDAGNIIGATNGSFIVKNSDGDKLLEYNGADNKFTASSDASNDLIQQVSNYETGKSSPGIKHLVQVSATGIQDDSKIDVGDSRNTAFKVNANIAQNIIVDNATQVISQAQTNINIHAKNVRRDYGDYFYPEDIRTNKQDRIRFTMRQSEGSDISPRLGGFEGSAGQNVRRRKTKEGVITGSVTLPMQPGITDANAVDWNPGQLNAVQAFGAGASLNLMNSPNGGSLFTKGGQILQQVASELTRPDGPGGNTYASALKVYLAQQAVGVQGLLSRTTGAVLNPNMELLFNAPALRPFTFNFVLSPRDESEAKQVKQIIRFFKQGMSVKTTSSIFLKAPHIFDIRYQTFDKNGTEIKDHPSLNRIKTCALTSFNVDYTPSGSYMTFNDNERTMTQYAIQMNLTELNPIYEDDYQDGGAGADAFSDGTSSDRKALSDDEIGF